MKLNRNQLAQVFKNHETLRAFEQALNSLDDTIPTNMEEATALAAYALAAAQTAIASISALADAVGYVESAPAALPIVDTDDMTPRAHLGTISSQDADNVDINGGSITNMTRNDATGVSLTDDTTTNATMYPVFGTAAGTSSMKISTTKLTWNPSTGLLTAPSVSAQLNGTLGLTTPAAAAVTTLSASGQITSTIATGTAPFAVASTTVVPNLNVSQLLGGTWAIPGAIGSTTKNTGAFTTLSATGQITSTLATGTAPFSIASTTVVPNLNVSQLLGGTWAVPGTIGSTTPNSGAFTTLTTTSNAAVGTTSSSWGSGFRAVEVGAQGNAYFSATSGSFNSLLTNNAYYDGSNWRYVRNQAATHIEQINGAFNFEVAASGTAGNVITWTQQMNISATGIGFFGTSATAKPTITGSRGGNAALASFLTGLAGLGLITDSTTA